MAAPPPPPAAAAAEAEALDRILHRLVATPDDKLEEAGPGGRGRDAAVRARRPVPSLPCP